MGRTLLHVCCGPCASACVPRLKASGRDMTLLFANSNIDTREEFDRRLAAAKRLASEEGVPIRTIPYDHDEWLREVAAGHEHDQEKGERCARCFRYNLAKAAQFARAHGFDDFTTSLTVSPHKVSEMVFAAGDDVVTQSSTAVDGQRQPLAATDCHSPRFLREDFKKREGFKLSVRRAAELGLYRQAYCGCEFSRAPHWRIHHQAVTASTNLDARAGMPGDVFTADFQTAGRGRLDHSWISPPGTNLMMSAVLSVEGLSPEHVSTLPLVVGLAVARALSPFLQGLSPAIKWPNDVLVGGRKIAGILCERQGENAIVGIGVNVGQTEFSPEIADKATSLAILSKINGVCPHKTEVVCPKVLREVLAELGCLYGIWLGRGFTVIYPDISAIDWLKGQRLVVRQTDDDSDPIAGVSGGVQPDGSLDVGGVKVYAGEAHVSACATDQ